MEPFERRLREYLDISEEEWEGLIAPATLPALPDISGHPSFKAVLKRLEEARLKGERILVYGDYDCDGVMSASITLRALREFGLNAAAYLPSRYLDGYGLTEENVGKIAKAGYKIVFAVDNGVTAHPALRKCRDLDVESIVLDHHEFDDIEPETPYVLHPKRLGYGQEPNCAGFLSYIFYRSLLKKDDPYLLTLAATSTISDAMPLRHENRLMVRLGLKALNECRFPEFSILLSNEKKIAPYTERDLSLDIIPKINAVGRLEKGTRINRLITYFAKETPAQEKTAIAKYLIETNENRKNLTKTLVSSLNVDDKDAAVTVLIDAPEGLNGLLASRLLSEYDRPVASFAKSDRLPGVLIGSLRAPYGFDVMEFLGSTDVPLLRHGGHPQAAGCSIEEKDLPLFKGRYAEAAEKAVYMTPEEKTLAILPEEVTEETYGWLRLLSPYGVGFPEPVLELPPLPGSSFKYLKSGLYLSFPAGEGKVLSFVLGKKDFLPGESYLLSGRLVEKEFRGAKELTFQAEKARKAS